MFSKNDSHGQKVAEKRKQRAKSFADLVFTKLVAPYFSESEENLSQDHCKVSSNEAHKIVKEVFKDSYKHELESDDFQTFFKKYLSERGYGLSITYVPFTFVIKLKD